MNIGRREWLLGTVLLAGAGALGYLRIFNAAEPLASRKSLLGPADGNGVRVPPGFKVRLVATSSQPVAATDYLWHRYPDGGATFAVPGGGWVYVSNSEVPEHQGGVSALRFNSNGDIVAAYSLLSGTTRNCAGGSTPWGTWLSCEEIEGGLVYECDPQRPGQGIARPALGRFMHEAAAVDPTTSFVYLTEDDQHSRFYRFRPQVAGKLEAGALEAAQVAPDGTVSWISVSPDAPYRGEDSTVFARGEGLWHAAGVIYFTTTADHRVWAYTLATSRLAIVYDANVGRDFSVLRDPDNLTVHELSGALLVAEDPGDVQLIRLVPDHDRWAATPFVQFEGHEGSEVTGPAFSPDGSRLYVSSQRGRDGEHGSICRRLRGHDGIHRSLHTWDGVPAVRHRTMIENPGLGRHPGEHR
jgi:uncharacterized protein